MFLEKTFAIHRLRVNVKSLSAESKIIRKESKKAAPDYRNQLEWHRIYRLRNESRMAQLALAFIRGIPYKEVEKTAKVLPDCKTLLNKINRFYRADFEDVHAWLGIQS
jgi:hypothetical protein